MGLLMSIAKGLHLENTVRHAPIFQPLWRWRNPTRFAKIEQDRAFFSELLAPRQPKCIFDVGANVGDKAITDEHRYKGRYEGR